MATSFLDSPGNFWDLVRVDAGHAQVGDAKTGWLCLASAAANIFTVLPNAADPERVSSELGRMIISARTSLAYIQSSRMLLITADYRAKMREKARASDRSGEYSKINKKFSDAAAALQRLKEIPDCSVTAMSDVPVGGVILATRSEDEGSEGSGRNGGSGITVRNGSDVIATANSGVSVIESIDGSDEPNGVSGLILVTSSTTLWSSWMTRLLRTSRQTISTLSPPDLTPFKRQWALMTLSMTSQTATALMTALE
jgi:hypothetical protein